MPFRITRDSKNLKKRTVIYDDFADYDYDSSLWYLVGITGATYYLFGPDGILRLNTATTSGYWVEINSNQTYNWNVANNINMLWSGFWFTENLTLCRQEIGLRNGAPPSPTNYVKFFRDTNVSTNFFGYCDNGSGTPATVNLGFGMTEWRQYQFEIFVSSSLAEFWVDGSLVGTLNTKIPTVDLEAYTQTVTWTSAVRMICSDYVYVAQDRYLNTGA